MSFFKKTEALVAIDIGSTGVKLVELELTGDKPRLKNISSAPLTGELFSNNAISKPDQIAEQLNGLIESNGIEAHRVVTSMPGPSVFTKKVQVPRMSASELRENINFEAGNYIPHSIEDVRLDYHILKLVGKNQLELLLVAVKNEIIESYLEAISLSGLECAVADVDFFALQNIFEQGYPEMLDKTVAIVHIGARFTIINIIRGGQSLVTGNVSIGGRTLTETLMQDLGITFDEAEALKKSRDPKSKHAAAVNELIDVHIEYVASELNRQLGFFWNTSGEEGAIDAIYLSGGGSSLPRLAEELREKTGIDTQRLDCFRGIDCSGAFDKAYLEEIQSSMSICAGLALRQTGDKIVPDYD